MPPVRTFPRASDADRDAVLRAFLIAEAQGKSLVRCYVAAVKEWRRRHPDHYPEYAGTQAVEIILDSRIKSLLEVRRDPMSWETLPDRGPVGRATRTEWGMSVRKTGITIWIPRGHALNKSECVITQIGKADDAGWIRLVPSTNAGRRINSLLAKKNTKDDTPRYIKYKTLPGAPGELRMTELETRPDGDAVKVKLPWRVPGAPFSMQAGKPTNFVAR